MGRIRSIKPELFRHEGLQELQAATSLPVMLTFIGLFTQADRDGRFKWAPRVLKLDILPFIEFDMAATLTALEEAGFIRRYRVDGKEYGDIPSWATHQVVNIRESQSVIPAYACTCAHVKENESPVNARGEGEGKGREEERERERESAREAEAVPVVTPTPKPASSSAPPSNPDLTAMVEQIVMAHPRSLTRKQRWGEAGYSQKTAVLKAMQDEIDASGCSGAQALEMILARVELQAREVPPERYQFFKDIERYFALHEYRLDPEHFNREDRNASTQGNRAGGVQGLGNRKADAAANALDSFYARIDAEAEESRARGAEGMPEPGREPGPGSPGVVLEGAC